MTLIAQTFDQLINFTRTSAGTFVGSNGLIQNTPASVNLLTFTQEFDNAAWNKAAGSVIVTANSTTAPDGTPTADTITESTGTSTHNIYNGFTSVSGSTYAWSGYVKANGRTIVQLSCQGTGLLYVPEFDLVALTTVTRVGSGTATITAVGDGWLRITAVTAATGSGTGYWQLNLCSAANTANYTGNGTSGVFLWGAQVELGSTATTYTRNFGGRFPPRFDFDPVTLLPRGLLVEEQRTNLVTYSEQLNTAPWFATNVTVTANTTVAPDGATTADTLDEGTTTGIHRVYRQGVTYTAAAHTASIFVKAGTGAWFQLVMYDGTTAHYANFNASTGATGNKSASATSSITPAGNGWYRCAITATTAATASGEFNINLANTNIASTIETYTGTSRTLFFWGAQLEAGAFATSYIPTVASQVTRTADVVAIAAPNFSPFYNQREGTFVAEYSQIAATASQIKALAIASDGSSNNTVYTYVGTTGLPNGLVANGGVTQANPNNSAISSNTTTKTAFAYKVDDFALVTGGGAAATDASGTVPTVNRLGIGTNSTGTSSSLNGHIRSIDYYPVRLTNATLQALTT